MERASRLIGKFASGKGPIEPADLACAAWPQAVGKIVASRTRASRMVRTRLIVEVEDHIWQKQLFTLSPQILRNLESRLGPGIVADLEFRVIPRRREPQRAQQAQPSLVSDDADSIADPVLRALYKTARKRAGA